MKRLVLSAVAFLLLVACGGQDVSEETTETTEVTSQEEKVIIEEAPVNSIILSENIVGIFELGKEVPSSIPSELSMRQFTEEVKSSDGQVVEHVHNVVFNQLEDLVELTMNQTGEHHEDKLIQEMLVLSNYYETAEGIAVGSTIEDFQAAYGDATAWYSKTLDAYLLETESILGTQFILDASACSKKPGGSTDLIKMNFNKFTEGSKIAKIRVY